jgi:hypothetical protein
MQLLPSDLRAKLDAAAAAVAVTHVPSPQLSMTQLPILGFCKELPLLDMVLR